MARALTLTQMRAGQYIVVKYNVDEDLYHMRYLIQEAEAASASWAIMTPDGDVYY